MSDTEDQIVIKGNDYGGIEVEDLLKQLIETMIAPPAQLSWRIKDGKWFDLNGIGNTEVSIRENNRKYLIHLLQNMSYE